LTGENQASQDVWQGAWSRWA